MFNLKIGIGMNESFSRFVKEKFQNKICKNCAGSKQSCEQTEEDVAECIIDSLLDVKNIKGLIKYAYKKLDL